MPLASPIGTGRGINNQLNLSYIIKIQMFPLLWMLVLFTKDACHAMELGADAILLNTAVSGAKTLLKWLKQ